MSAGRVGVFALQKTVWPGLNEQIKVRKALPLCCASAAFLV